MRILIATRRILASCILVLAAAAYAMGDEQDRGEWERERRAVGEFVDRLRLPTTAKIKAARSRCRARQSAPAASCIRQLDVGMDR